MSIYRNAEVHEAAYLPEDSEKLLTYMELPREHWTKLHSTNVQERPNRELTRRTRVASVFPNGQSLSRLVGTHLLGEHEQWMLARPYISERSMKLLKSPAEELEELVAGAGVLLETAARPVPPGALGALPTDGRY